MINDTRRCCDIVSQAERQFKPCVNGDTSFLWNRPNFDPLHDTVDYVREIYHQTYLKTIGSVALLVKCVKYTIFATLFFLPPDVGATSVNMPFVVKIETFQTQDLKPRKSPKFITFGAGLWTFSLDVAFGDTAFRNKYPLLCTDAPWKLS